MENQLPTEFDLVVIGTGMYFSFLGLSRFCYCLKWYFSPKFTSLPVILVVVMLITGMVESVVSAAASRIGKTVLHIDR